jgi:CheY-like chemotaxis protein
VAHERVLVVDDSPTILKVVELVLSKAGYEVHTAADGETGIAQAKARRPHVILLDFVLPRLNGFEVCQALARDPDLAEVPVVLMSAKGDRIGQDVVAQMGVADFITKPFSPDGITAVISHTIEKRRLGRGLTPEPLLRVEPQPAVAAPEAFEPALTGDLRVIPLVQVLELLAEQRQWGVLTVMRGSSTVEVCFRDGVIDLVAASGVSEEFLLGRFLLKNNLITRPDLDDALQGAGPGRERLGARLVRLGKVTESDLQRVLAEQTTELVWELLRWNYGRFLFVATHDLPQLAVQAALALQVDVILMEGFRRVDEWHLIEKEVDSFDLVFVRNDEAYAQFGPGRLSRDEIQVLDLVNSKNTVKEIVRQSRMGSFDVSKILYRLLRARLVRKRVLPVAV